MKSLEQLQLEMKQCQEDAFSSIGLPDSLSAWKLWEQSVELYRQALIASKYTAISSGDGVTVKTLRELLAKYPDDMVIICDRHSDYAKASNILVVDAVDKGSWLMRRHPTMLAENKAGAKQYLLIE